jgi:phosphatidylglycerophosphate synthase
MGNEPLTRRPLASRETGWARVLAATLARWRVRPNTISILSIGCAMLAGAALLATRDRPSGQRALLFVLAIVGIQARLLCNLFDGMVAVEGGMKTKTGEIYNELPDRIADAIIFVCGGYSVVGCRYSVFLGWTTAVMALITAYVRALGASMGAGQQFRGPMAKQHRMATMTVACALSAIEALLNFSQIVLQVAFGVMILGMIVTIARRLMRISKAMEAR